MISGRAFVDRDADGLQRVSSDVGIDTVRVRLECPPSGRLVDSRRTAFGGEFRFDSVPTNQACAVVFNVESTALQKAAPTLQNVGEDDSVDSDCDSNGKVVIDAAAAAETIVDCGFVLQQIEIGNSVW